MAGRKPAKEAARPARPWLPALLLCAIAFLAYANSFGLGLTTDARAIVAADTRIRELTAANLNLIFHRDYWWPQSIDVLYRPVTILSYLVNYAVLGNGEDPAGYHAVNFLLHAVNILLVFALCRRLFGKDVPAFFAAALWAVHPIGTESVTNVSGRADLLAATGVLGGLVLYLHSREWTGRRFALAVAGLFGLAALGAFSKENGAVLPGLMLLWDSLDLPGLRRDWKRRAPLYAAPAAALALLFWMRHAIFAARPWPKAPYLDNPLVLVDFWTARFTAIKVLGLQLWLMLCPLQLASDRSYGQIAMSSAGDLMAWLALVVVLAILAAAVLRYRRDPVLYFAIGFTAIAVLPTSNLLVLIGSILAERFLYLPSVGFAIAVVALAFRLKDERTARTVLAVVVIVFAVRTFVRNFDWKDNLTLFSADVNVSSGSFRTHDLLARGLFVRDPQANIDRAIQEGERACQILRGLPPEYTLDDTLRHLGLYYATKGDMVRERIWYEKALEVLLRARAATQASEANFDRQQLAHGRPLAQRVALPAVFQSLGAVYARLGEHTKAIEALRYGRALNPMAPEFYPALSTEYLAAGDAPRAAATLLQRAQLEGMKPETLYGLREAFAKVSGGECAISPEGVNYGCPVVRQQTCAALGDLAQAFVEARKPALAEAQRLKAAQQFGCPAL